MPREIAAGFALTAVLASAGLLTLGAVCGIESTTATCDATGCGPPVVECTPAIDPLLWGSLAVSLAAVATAFTRAHAAALALAVVAAGLGAYLRMPRLDAEVYVLLALLLIAGIATPDLARWRAHLLSLTALIAFVIPLVMVPLLYDMMPQPEFGKLPAPPEGMLQVVTLLPMALWLILAARETLTRARS